MNASMADRPLIATYRLQLTPSFTLDDAAQVVPYLARLGISHVYCSPYLRAVPGSMHGYDIVDHAHVNDELGGEVALLRFHEALLAAGLGQVIDVVPNHMAIGDPRNRLWWDVLENGEGSDSARFFDIDWHAVADPAQRGKVLVAVLSDPYGDVLARGELQLVVRDGELELAYFDHRFPIAKATAPTWRSDADLAALNADASALHHLLEAQHYRLAWWRTARHELNYRRFFDVSTLAGLRVEDPHVFAAVHARVLEWVSDGAVHGLRIDHPDGLRDPAGYLHRLRESAPSAWIVVEKILESGEALPASWPVDGTTGYDVMRRLTAVFVDPAGEDPLTELYQSFVGDDRSYDAIVDDSKQYVIDHVLPAEVSRLADMAHSICRDDLALRDFTKGEITEAIEALLRAMPVYRTYCTSEAVSTADAHVIDAAVRTARTTAPNVDRRVFDWFVAVWRHEARGDRSLDLADRLQQLTGPVMAKGVEDTAFYRYNRLLALNEVGSDPSVFGITVEGFHRGALDMGADWPLSMSATSTHDSKRSEDVRVRIALLSMMPRQLEAAVTRWGHRNRAKWAGTEPDLQLEYMLYQTLIGAHPLPRERAHLVASKSMREAKQRTSWLQPNYDFEGAAHDFIDALYDDEAFLADLGSFCRPLAVPGRLAGLSLLALKATVPGVPDFYQGSELWMDSLVDPDNRRNVDFALRAGLLDGLETADGPPNVDHDDVGMCKLWLTRRLLEVRRRNAPAFIGESASYEPLPVSGALSDGVIAFVRGETIITVASARPVAVVDHHGWGDTTVKLPAGRWADALVAGRFFSGHVAVQDITATYQLALLVKDRDR